MLKRIRRELRDVCEQKHQCFDDFQKIILRIAANYGSLFPKLTQNTDGSHYVYDFGIAEIPPITIVKPHKGNEYVPRFFAKRVINGLKDVLDYIEANTPDDEAALEQERANVETVVTEETPGLLPQPKIPDGNRGR